MRTPPRPADESERLEALERYVALDAPPSTTFDEITRLAALYLDVPIALVSMVDAQTQWFRAKFGLDVDRTSRDISFCGHAILDDDVFVIPDALADERFADNPLVTGEPHVRFYAGAPLRTPSGHRIGTLCVIDRKPRSGLTPPEHRALVALAALVVDEFELRLTTAELRERERELSRDNAVIAASTDYISLVSPDGEVIALNPAAMAMVGLPPGSDVTGRRIADFRSEEATRVMLETAFPAAIATGSWRGESDVRAADGTVIPVDQVILCHRDDDGAVAYFSAVARDISDRNEIVRLQQVQRMKDEFISTASHELRTPITSVVASLGMLADGVVGELPTEMRDVIDIALVNANRLVRLVDALLDLSKLSDGSVELVRVEVRARSVVESAISVVAPIAETHGVSIVVDDAANGAEISVDVERMERALVNLIGNATKFSPSGATVAVELDEDDRNFRITVVDEGPGIDPAMISRLFDPFWQADSSATRSAGGTGLGLAITRRIVENHGGRITVESTVGVGSRFRVELPREA